MSAENRSARAVEYTDAKRDVNSLQLDPRFGGSALLSSK